ncbi:MAG: DUF1318 domain-containing protein [Deltaproteobacteria bacterium]|nr:DUF1318 domain-containing protein [Deltaproteobacteria bacterium]
MKKYIAIVVFIASALLATTALGALQDIKARMKARMPVIKEMKVNGFVGENALGYMVKRGETAADETIIRSENADRRLVYFAIAKQQNTTPERVGKRRAIQIFKLAKLGEWLQNENGLWFQKK